MFFVFPFRAFTYKQEHPRYLFSIHTALHTTLQTTDNAPLYKHTSTSKNGIETGTTTPDLSNLPRYANNSSRVSSQSLRKST